VGRAREIRIFIQAPSPEIWSETISDSEAENGVAYFWATSFGKNLSAAAAINPCLGCSVRFLRLPPLQKLRPMSDDEFAAIIGIVEQQPIQAQACLDLFEKDHGRRAYTTSEVRNWADGQDPESLRFRILRRVRADHGWKKACKRIWNDIPTSLISRPPMGQRIYLTLAEAARATGLSEVAVLDAIEQGRIAGMKDMQDTWHVDRDTLCRAFPSARASVAKSDAAKSDSGKGRPLDAATLVLEVGMSTLVRQAGGRLRGWRLWWR